MVEKLHMKFSENNVPNFGSIVFDRHEKTLHLLEDDIEILKNTLTRAVCIGTYNADTFYFRSGDVAVVDNSQKTFVYNSDSDSWHERVIDNAASESDRTDEIEETLKTSVQKFAIANYIGSDVGKKDPDGTNHTTPEMLYGTDYDSLTKTGLYVLRGNTDYPTVNAPNGNNSNNIFYVLVLQYGLRFSTQIAFGLRTEDDVYIRCFRNTEWEQWKRLYSSDNVIDESGTWIPAAETGSITVSSAYYIYDGKSITVTATIECGSDISTSLKLSGLPISAKSEGAGSCAVSEDAAFVSAVVRNNGINILSDSLLAGKTLIVSAKYII